MNKKQRKGRTKRANPKPCLIIECNSNGLGMQNIAYADELSAILNQIDGCEAVVLKTTRFHALATQFSEIAGTTFKVIVIIGHGNDKGMQFTEDEFLPYEAVAKWVIAFSPKHLVLISCKGGGFNPSQIFFDSIKSVKSIFGSPCNSTKLQHQLQKVIIPTLIIQNKIGNNLLLGLQAGNFLLTGGIIFYQRRNEFRKHPLKSIALDISAQVLDALRTNRTI